MTEFEILMPERLGMSLALKEEWEKLDLESIMNLYSSMPRRVEALKCAKSSYTKY